MDHAGLPLKTVLEQLDLLGEEVVPVLRKEFDALRPAHVPDGPTHASLLDGAHSRGGVVSTPRIAVVSAGLSQPSSTRLLADRLAEATTRGPRRRGAAAVIESVELRDHARDLADQLVTGFAPAGLREAIERVTGADALIAVTPIFTASYSGLFKSFFDVLDPTRWSASRC